MAVEALVPPDAARVATVYTIDPKRLREAVLADLCTLLCPRACPLRRTSRKGALCTRPSIAARPKSAFCPSASPKTAVWLVRGHRVRLSVTLRRPGSVGQPPARLRGGLHECPQISVRSLASRKSALCRRRNHNSVHKCPKTAPRGRFRRSVYTLCPHGRSCDRVGPRVPQRQRPYGPRDAKVLGPEAHNCRGGGTFALPGAPLAARCPRMSQARYTQDA